MQLAVALYNNHVDDEEELEFRKGDILTVLIENPHGLEGWWLCQHQGKSGLCPGNRLKLISSTSSNAKEKKTCDRFPSRFSTVSTYDDLSTAHDYDNNQFVDYSVAESSSRSSGISSAIDLHLSSSSTDFYTSHLNIERRSNELQLLQRSFEKLAIRSNLLETYHQLITEPTFQHTLLAFINECRRFLHDYGYLLDRYTYKVIKEHFLNELQHTVDHTQRINQLSTRIIELLQPILTLRVQQKSQTTSNPHHKVPQSLATSQNYGHSDSVISRSKRSHSSLDPLIKCYYRHIREHAESLIKRYSFSNKSEQKLSSIIVDGKTFLVAGQKLLFVLETLDEHLQQRQTPLSLLTRQLNEALTVLLQLLKQISQSNSLSNHHHQQLKQQTKSMINLVKRIKLQCTSSND